MNIRTNRARWFLAAMLWASAAVAACGVVDLNDVDLDGSGTVRFVDVEGGCWVIDTESERLEPINLGEQFRVDGLFVLFTANRRLDLASICQVGQLVEIVSIVVPQD